MQNGDKLDDQCKEYLQEAYDSTCRMNQLIDTLLNFSRLIQKDLSREMVDLSGIAQTVAAGLKLADPAHRVTFRITEGMSAKGDECLLQVVLENLLGNAWKYTRSKEEAIIEFGMTEIDGQPVWFVRDNGPGFDMEDAVKLFTPFQRLTGTADSAKGHGIGLATVERIIRRHGGRVWAEGEAGKGATFYFTF
jgi:signal transduction histidine kinase